MKNMIVALDTAIQARPSVAGVNGVKIMAPEAARWDHLTGVANNGNGDDNFNQLFRPSSANYVGNPVAMKPWMVAGHTYFTHGNDIQARTYRENVAAQANSYGNVADNDYQPIQIQSTEWCALGNGEGFPNIETYFDVGLFMAKLAYIDITVANAAFFSFWTALDMERGGYARYSLIGYTPGASIYSLESYKDYPITSPGAIKTQPTLWALGNYSLFVRPGFRRIKLSGDIGDQYMGVMASAYKSPPGYRDSKGKELNRVVIVYVNMGTGTDAGCIAAAEFPNGTLPINIRCFETTMDNTSDAANNRNGLRSVNQTIRDEGGIYTIKPRSILTVVYDFKVTP